MGKGIGLKGGPNYLVKDQQGQWKYPGQNTRIMGNDITMKGVPYPVWAQPNVGPPTLMNPGKDYYFPNADYVDESPILPSYQSKGEINSIFDPRYKEYKKIRKENKNIESLNKEIDAAKDAYELRWSVVDDYTDSTEWMNSPEFLGFEQYKDLVKPGEATISKKFKTGSNLIVDKSWGESDWEGAKSPTIENYHRKLPRHSMTDDEYQQYISWAQTNNPEYFAEHNIEELLKGLPPQNIVVRSMIHDLGYPTNNEENNFTINTNDIIEPQPTIEQVEQEQIEYKKLLQKDIVELNREKNDLQSLEARSGLNQSQKERLNQIQAMLQGDAGYVQDNMQYNQGIKKDGGDILPIFQFKGENSNEPTRVETGTQNFSFDKSPAEMEAEFDAQVASYDDQANPLDKSGNPITYSNSQWLRYNYAMDQKNKNDQAAQDRENYVYEKKLQEAAPVWMADKGINPNTGKPYTVEEFRALNEAGQLKHYVFDENVTGPEGELEPIFIGGNLPDFEIETVSDETQRQRDETSWRLRHEEEMKKRYPAWETISDNQKETLWDHHNPYSTTFGSTANRSSNPLIRQAIIEGVRGGDYLDDYGQQITDAIVKPGMTVAALPLVASALPYVMPAASEVMGTKVVGDVTVGGLMDAYGAYHGATHLPGDVQEFANNPTWGNAGSIGLDLFGIGAGGYAAAKQYIPTIKSGYNAVATGNSPLPIAWKSGLNEGNISAAYQGSKNYDALKGANLTDEEAEIVRLWQHSPADIKGADRLKLDEIVAKYNLGDQSINTPISRIQGYYGSQKNFPTEYGSKVTWDSPRSWSTGAWKDGAPLNPAGTQRIVIPERYAKNMGEDFFKVPIKENQNLQDLINTTNVGTKEKPFFMTTEKLLGEKELLGMPNLKVIGRDNTGHFNDIIVKPVKSSKTSSTKPNIIKETDEVVETRTTLNQADDTDWANIPDNTGVDTEFWPGTYIPKKPQKVDTQPSTFYGNEKYNQSLTEVNEQIAKQNELISEHNIKVNTGKASKDPKVREQFKDQTTLPYKNLEQPLENVDDHIMPLIENFNNPAAKEKLINLGVKDPDDFIQYLLNEVQYTNVPGRGGYAGSSVGNVSGVDDLVNLGIGQHTERFAYVPNITSHTGDHEIGHLIQRYMEKRGLNLPQRTYSVKSTKTGLPIEGISPKTVNKPMTKFDEEASEFFRNFKKEDDWLSTKDAENFAYTQKDYNINNKGNLLLPQDRYKVQLKDLTDEANAAAKNIEEARMQGMGDKGFKSYFRDKETKDLWQSMVEHQELANKRLSEFTKRYPDETTFINQTTHQHEPLAMLRELRNELYQNGIIKNFQDPIDEKTLMQFWKSDAGKQNRILSFLQPSTEGKKGIIDLINRTPVVAGAVATGGLGVAAGSSGSNEGMQYGGALPKAQNGNGNFIKKMSAIAAKAAPSAPATSTKLEQLKLMQKLFEQRENTIPQEMLVRQAYKESTFDPEAVSPAGYKGIAQLGDAVIKDYKKATGETEVDPFDPEDATKVQKWYMDHLYNASFINKPNQSPIVRRAKTFAAYNWGRGNMSEFLNNQKEKGVDIYSDDMKWLESLPEETKDYVHKIVLADNEKWEEEYLKSKHDSISETYYDQLFELPKKQTGDEIKTDSVYVSQGEIGPRIAAKFGITLKELLDANPGVNPMMIAKGTSINIPGVGTPIQQTVVEETIAPVEQPIEQTIVTPPVTPIKQPVTVPSTKEKVVQEVVQQKPVINKPNKITSVNTPTEPVITEQPKPIVKEETTEKLLPKIDFTQYEYKAEPSTTDVNLITMPVESFMPPGDNTVVNINDTLTLGEHHYAYDPNKKEPPKPKEKDSPLDIAMNWIDDKIDNLHRGYVKYMDGDVYSTEKVDVDINLEEEKSPLMDKVDLFNARLALNAKEGETPLYVDGVSGETNIQESPNLEKVNLIKPIYKDLGTVKDSKGNLMMYQNSFDAKNGFNYVPIKNYGKSDDNTQYSNVKGIAHFLLDSDLTDGYKHPYAKKMIADQLNGKPVAPGSTVTDGYFPVYERLENGQVNIKYLKKNEIKDYASIASPLRQYKWSDLNWDGRTSAQGFQSTVSSIPTSKSYTIGGKKSNETHLIFPTSNSRGGKNAYGRFGGTGVIFFIERPNGQREAIEMAGSINMIKKTANEIMKKYKLKPEELIFGYHDVGSFSARPQASNGKLDFNQWSGFNKASNPHVGGALAFPSMKVGGEMGKKQNKKTDKLQVYKDYINGVYDNTDDITFAEKVYDKLNRMHYKDAKKLGMHVPNYIMTHIIKKGNE